MSLAPGQTKACEACGVAMIGALTRDGKVAPIEVDPDATRGNVLLFKAPANGHAEPVLQCRTFAGFALGELQAERVPMRLNHFAFCPERDRFKGGARG